MDHNPFLKKGKPGARGSVEQRVNIEWQHRAGAPHCFNPDGTHNFTVGKSQEPNPVQPAEVVAMAVRPHGSTTATQWITTHENHPDFVATYDSVGNEPDKQWTTIDTNPRSPHYNRIYAMWVDFHTLTPVPYVSYADAQPDGSHTDWSVPQKLPVPPRG